MKPDSLTAPAGLPAFEVVHSLPGRLRLRVARSDAERGAELVRWLERQPRVDRLRWVAAARSITIWFDPELPAHELFRRSDLPERSVPSSPASRPLAPLWRRMVLPAAALAFGLSGVGWLAVAGIGICSVPLARRAARSVLTRKLQIELLDAVGVALLLGIGDFFAAGLSLALIELGERIRREARGRARRVLRGWMAADRAGIRVLREGTEPRLPVEEVLPGERVVVYAGETIPVDGRVVGGAGSVDNRTWTGEWLPVPVGPGAEVLAGGALADGRVVVEVRASGDSTRAGRLAAALEDAIAADTRVADLAKRTADRFVLPVVLITGGVFAVTRDISRLVSMLVIDFGTGVRISIPTTVLTTMVAGARRNVLFKRGRAIEALATVDTIVFDKTGTLTEGRPDVDSVVPEPGFEPDEILRLAGAAEGHLPHPMAGAIRRAARRRHLDLPEAKALRYMPGGGVEAVVAGRRVMVGDRRLLESQGIQIPIQELTDSSMALVAVDGVFAGVIRMRDRVKASARQAVADLRRMGVRRLVLATGDHQAAARLVARQLGLDDWRWGMMPEDKTLLVEQLRRDGRVAVVGDGINDAAALAAADVGIAVPKGADLARETADVILLSEDLSALTTAFSLSRSAMGIVRQNIGLSAVPNSAALALATIGRLAPLAAAVVHNGATVLAAGNALRPLRS